MSRKSKSKECQRSQQNRGESSAHQKIGDSTSRLVKGESFSEFSEERVIFQHFQHEEKTSDRARVTVILEDNEAVTLELLFRLHSVWKTRYSQMKTYSVSLIPHRPVFHTSAQTRWGYHQFADVADQTTLGNYNALCRWSALRAHSTPLTPRGERESRVDLLDRRNYHRESHVILPPPLVHQQMDLLVLRLDEPFPMLDPMLRGICHSSCRVVILLPTQSIVNQGQQQRWAHSLVLNQVDWVLTPTAASESNWQTIRLLTGVHHGFDSRSSSVAISSLPRLPCLQTLNERSGRHNPPLATLLQTVLIRDVIRLVLEYSTTEIAEDFQVALWTGLPLAVTQLMLLYQCPFGMTAHSCNEVHCCCLFCIRDLHRWEPITS